MTEPQPRKPWYQLLPEETVYQDTGCDLSPSCLRCHLARCAEDLPWGRQQLRQRSIVATVTGLLQSGHTQVEIAAMLGMSVRTIGRYKNTYPTRKGGKQTQGAAKSPTKKGGITCSKRQSQRDTRSPVSNT